MIDIHTHLLPGADDGSSSLEESRKLLSNAIADGISDIIITVHYELDGYYHLGRDEYDRLFAAFKKDVADLEINLYQGNEIYIHERVSKELLRGAIATLAGSKYVLVEFPFSYYDDEFDDYLYDIRKAGYQVIIAHPERYDYVREDTDFISRWTEEGYLLQANASSLNHHKKTLTTLLDSNAISFMASDGHNLRRPVLLREAYEKIADRYGLGRADDLFVNNPQKILRNENW